MKLNERCSGPRFDPGQVHQKYSKLDAGSAKGESGLITTSKLEIKNTFDGPEFGLDRAMSKDMDNTVGDDRKSSKTINANDAFYGEERLAA